jgi:hypothetical protein
MKYNICQNIVLATYCCIIINTSFAMTTLNNNNEDLVQVQFYGEAL